MTKRRRRRGAATNPDGRRPSMTMTLVAMSGMSSVMSIGLIWSCTRLLKRFVI